MDNTANQYAALRRLAFERAHIIDCYTVNTVSLHVAIELITLQKVCVI